MPSCMFFFLNYKWRLHMYIVIKIHHIIQLLSVVYMYVLFICNDLAKLCTHSPNSILLLSMSDGNMWFCFNINSAKTEGLWICKHKLVSWEFANPTIIMFGPLVLDLKSLKPSWGHHLIELKYYTLLFDTIDCWKF